MDQQQQGRAGFTPTGGGQPQTRPTPYSWALSQGTSAELRLSGARLTKAEADRLRQYVDLTLAAITDENAP